MKEKLAQYRALIESETDVIAVMANTSAFIMENISGLNWAGFYQMKGDELVLGHFKADLLAIELVMEKESAGIVRSVEKQSWYPMYTLFPGILPAMRQVKVN